MALQYQCDGIRFVHSKQAHPTEGEFDLHVHDSYEILCFVSGNTGYLVEGREYNMHPGCLMLMRPAEAHKLLLRGDAEYERYIINFRADALPPFLQELLGVFHDRALGEKNRYLIHELNGVDPVSLLQRVLQQSDVIPLRVALLSALSALLCATNVAFPNKQSKHDRGDDVGRRLLTYINDNLTTELSLSDISAHIHLSPSQLNRVFRDLTGTSVYDYILSKRIIMAQGMLEEGEGAVAVCRRCGFGNYSSFYRLYKKRTGHAPTSPQKP